jgi:glycosyltransferase involved in cell wall biosynthesis
MNSKRRRILFFTPYATRTGSEMIIYYLLKHYDRSRFEIGLVCFKNGELLKDLPADVRVFIAPGDFTLTQKVAFHMGFDPLKRFLKKIIHEFQADLWYVNTVMLPDMVQAAKDAKIPVITHVHELSATFSQIKSQGFETIVKNSDLLIGCSDIVCKCLTESGGTPVERLYPFVDLKEITPDQEKVRQIRADWGAGSDDFVWIMSGTSSERKGFDLLPDIALHIPEQARMHLVWVGSLSDDGLVFWTKKRCEQLNNVQIHLIGSKKEDYYSYMDAADGFMLTSRQEPFGMVLVEAAWLGKPIVSFASGGPSEFITPELGTVVPNLDLSLFAESMLQWNNKMSGFNKETSRQKALEYSVEKGVTQWESIIDNF